MPTTTKQSPAASKATSRKSTSTPRKPRAGAQVAAQESTKATKSPRIDSAAILAAAATAKDVAALAKALGVDVNDAEFRRRVNFLSQGKRGLDPKFNVRSDAWTRPIGGGRLHSEPRPKPEKKAKPETPDLSDALAESVKQAKSAKAKQPSRSAKIRAMVDELGESPEQARASLRDMS